MQLTRHTALSATRRFQSGGFNALAEYAERHSDGLSDKRALDYKENGFLRNPKKVQKRCKTTTESLLWSTATVKREL